MSNYGMNKYKQTQVTTASPGHILLMLYEAAIKYTKQAIEATKAKKLADKGVAILKVQDIINELSLTLNHDVGADVSKELARLYVYIVDLLTEANVKNDYKPLETILKLLETLYDGWKGAVSQVAKAGGDATALAAQEKNKSSK
jgi:flagellar protein FliS